MDPDIQAALDQSIQAGADPAQARRLAQQIMQQRGSQQPGLLEQTFSQGFSKNDPNQGFVERVASTFTRPFERTFKTAGEAINTAFTPGMVKSALGFELTPEELESVSQFQPKFLTEEEIKDRGTILKEGAKTGAGISTLAIPTGGTVKTALALGSAEGVLDAFSRDEDLLMGGIAGAGGQLVAGVAIPGAFNAVKSRLIREGIGSSAEVPLKKGVKATVKNAGTKGGAAVAEISIGPEKVIKNAGEDIAGRGSLRARLFANNFQIPTKRASDLLPVKTSQQMIDLGVVGDFDDMARAINTTTGQNGAVSKYVRQMLRASDTPIPLSPINKQIDDLADDLIAVDPKIVSRIKSQLVKQVDDPLTTTNTLAIELIDDVLGKSPKQIAEDIEITGFIPPEKAFDLVQQFESLGHQFKNSSTYLTKNVKNEQIGEIYIQSARQLEKIIAETIDDKAIIKSLDKTGSAAQLQQISDKLAKRFLNAKTFRELRNMQSPFVRLAQMIDLTEQAQFSAANKLGRNLLQSIWSPIEGLSRPVVGDIKTQATTRLAGLGVKGVGEEAGETATQRATRVLAGRTAGEFQEQMQRQTGQAFLADFDQAINAKNFTAAREIFESLPDDSAYKAPMQNVLNMLDEAGGAPGAAVINAARNRLAQLASQIGIPSARQVAGRRAAADIVGGFLPQEGGPETPQVSETVPLADAQAQTPQVQSVTAGTLLSQGGDQIQQVNGKYLSMDGQWAWNEQTQNWEPNISGGEVGAGITPNTLRQAIIEDLQLRGGKNIAKLEKAQKLLFPEEGEARPLTGEQQKMKFNAESGLAALQVMEEELGSDAFSQQAKLAQRALPGRPGARIFHAARKEAQDVITRLRTGAAINATEEKFYSEQLPEVGDSPETIEYKLNLLRTLYNRFAFEQNPAGGFLDSAIQDELLRRGG